MQVQFIEYRGSNFSIYKPADWIVTSAPAYQFMFVAPLKVEQEKIHANLLFNQRQLEENVTIDEIVKLSSETQMKEYHEYKLLSEARDGNDYKQVYKRTYTWKNSEGLEIFQQQILLFIHSVLITITITRQNGAEFSYLDPIFSYMVNSIEFGSSKNT